MHVLEMWTGKQFNYAESIDRTFDKDEIVCTEVLSRVCKIHYLKQTMFREMLKKDVVGIQVELIELLIGSFQVVLHLW